MLNYCHPLKELNRMRKILRCSLRSQLSHTAAAIPTPTLYKDLDYYFIFEVKPCIESDSITWGLCVFDSNGEIQLCTQGGFPVGLWRFRRQGTARCADMCEGIVKNQLRRNGFPLSSLSPIVQVEENLYRININWAIYSLSRKEISHA